MDSGEHYINGIGFQTNEETFAERLENIFQELKKLQGQDDKAAFKKFLEAARLGKDFGNDEVHVMGLLNAAALACKMGDYDLCLRISTDAQNINEELWTNYFEEPHMQEMLKTLSMAGVFNE